jgi:hypothetical protein
MPGRAIATGPDLRAAKATDAGTTTSASEASAAEPLGRGITWDEKSTRQKNTQRQEEPIHRHPAFRREVHSPIRGKLRISRTHCVHVWRMRLIIWAKCLAICDESRSNHHFSRAFRSVKRRQADDVPSDQQPTCGSPSGGGSANHIENRRSRDDKRLRYFARTTRAAPLRSSTLSDTSRPWRDSRRAKRERFRCR